MAKRKNGGKRQTKRPRRDQEFVNAETELFELDHKRRQVMQVKPLEAMTEAQAHYMMSIEGSSVTFGVGPAGTGKTYVCGAMAADMLLDNSVERIILTRPAVEAGESFGFLPGELEEKYEPFLLPFRDVLNERLGKSRVDYLIKKGDIEPATLAHMRGRTFKNAFIILDEAQNVTVTQMKMFLTRIGKGCTVVINGDLKQKDIREQSGLEDAISRLSEVGGIRTVAFEREDVVRSGIVQEIIEAYET